MGCGSSISDTEALALHKRTGGKISISHIREWYKLWNKVAPHGGMSEQQYIQFITENNLATEFDALNTFKMMDVDDSGVLEFDEFICALTAPKPSELTPEQFATFCFSIYDGDRNGFITKDEIQKLAWSKAKAEGKGTQEQKDLIVDTVNKIFSYVDKNKDGMLSKAELISAVTKYPELKNVL